MADFMSRAKAVYLHDLAARLEDGRLDLERLQALDDDAARTGPTQVKGVGRFTADGVLMVGAAPSGRLARRRPGAAPCGRAGLGAGSPSVGRGGGRPRRALPAVADPGRRVPPPTPGGLTSGPRPRGVASLGDYLVCRE
jgi:hypothetical protein